MFQSAASGSESEHDTGACRARRCIAAQSLGLLAAVSAANAKLDARREGVAGGLREAASSGSADDLKGWVQRCGRQASVLRILRIFCWFATLHAETQ